MLNIHVVRHSLWLQTSAATNLTAENVKTANAGGYGHVLFQKATGYLILAISLALQLDRPVLFSEIVGIAHAWHCSKWRLICFGFSVSCVDHTHGKSAVAAYSVYTCGL